MGRVFQPPRLPARGVNPRSNSGREGHRPTRDAGTTAFDIRPAARGITRVTYNLNGWIEIGGVIPADTGMATTYNLTGDSQFSVDMNGTMREPLRLPAPPAPAPPESLGVFPMPTAGGVTIRALVSKTVTMDDPVIVDGKPT